MFSLYSSSDMPAGFTSPQAAGFEIRRVYSKVTNADDRRTRNSCELTCARNLYVCHTDLQQDFSRASFSHQIEHVLFDARNSQSRDSIYAHWLDTRDGSKPPASVDASFCIKNLMQVSRASFCCEFLVQVSRTSVFGIILMYCMCVTQGAWSAEEYDGRDWCC